MPMNAPFSVNSDSVAQFNIAPLNYGGTYSSPTYSGS